jgi:predicted Zn-dependent peptidase
VIAGDFDPVEAKKLVEKYFGTIPAGPALVDRPFRWIPSLSGEKVVEALDRVPQERVSIVRTGSFSGSARRIPARRSRPPRRSWNRP